MNAEALKRIVDAEYNQAIEDAAKLIEDKFDFVGNELLAASEIRKLKRNVGKGEKE